MFARENRLPTGAAKFVARQGRGFSGPFLRIKCTLTNSPVSRATVVVGLAFDKKATARNRIKRQLREALRPFLARLHPRVNIMVLVNKTAHIRNFQELQGELESLLRKSRLL
mgnify:FL=1